MTSHYLHIWIGNFVQLKVLKQQQHSEFCIKNLKKKIVLLESSLSWLLIPEEYKCQDLLAIYYI